MTATPEEIVLSLMDLGVPARSAFHLSIIIEALIKNARSEVSNGEAHEGQ